VRRYHDKLGLVPPKLFDRSDTSLIENWIDETERRTRTRRKTALPKLAKSRLSYLEFLTAADSDSVQRILRVFGIVGPMAITC